MPYAIVEKILDAFSYSSTLPVSQQSIFLKIKPTTKQLHRAPLGLVCGRNPIKSENIDKYSHVEPIFTFDSPFVDTGCTRIANTYDDEVDNAVAGLTAAIEPALIIFLAVVVGTIVIAMFLPMIKIISSVSGSGAGM